MSRVLMIAYLFPPELEVGRIRTIKFCKYLPQFGWRPVVLTHRAAPGYDPSLLNEIPPGTEVHRVGHGTLLCDMLAKARRMREAVRALRGRCRSVGGPFNETQEQGGDQTERPSGPGKVWLLFWPDLHGSWVLPAIRRGLALARRSDVIYSSGWPVSCHVVARRLAKITGRPWVMDYRDPWTLDWRYPTPIQRWLFQKWERDCVGACSHLINVNSHLTGRHREAFRPEPADKFLTIPNGFDPEDFEGLPQPAADRPLILTYAGSFYGGRSPIGLLRAIAFLHRSGRIQPGHLLLRLIGSQGETPSAVAAAAETLGVSSYVSLSGRIPYREALAALSASHVAVFIGGGRMDTVSMPTKLYEYFHLKKPVLAVLPKGALADLLAETGVSCMEHDATKEIADVLSGLLDLHGAGKPLPVPGALPDQDKHSRENAARRLAAIMNELRRPLR